MVEVLEDKLLRDVFACTLDASQATTSGEPPITYLHAVHEVTMPGSRHLFSHLRACFADTNVTSTYLSRARRGRSCERSRASR